MTWYLHALKNYAVFSGRAHRREYGWFVLINILAYAVVSIFSPELGLLFAFATIVPAIAAGVRRLHDLGSSAWALLWLLVPILGLVVWFRMLAREGEPGANKYGPNPTQHAPAPLPATV